MAWSGQRDRNGPRLSGAAPEIWGQREGSLEKKLPLLSPTPQLQTAGGGQGSIFQKDPCPEGKAAGLSLPVMTHGLLGKRQKLENPQIYPINPPLPP